MCRLHEHTGLKQVMVYKLVIAHKRKYYSLYAGLPIKKGKVDSATCYNKLDTIDSTLSNMIKYRPGDDLYSGLAIGRTMGYYTLELAKRMKIENWKEYESVVILEMLLGGSIVTDGIDTYAGSEIISYKKVKL